MSGTEKSSRERPEIIGLDMGGMDPKYGGVISYRVDEHGNHIDRLGDVISTPESRAKEDVPQWRKFELGRLDIVDNVVIPGPAALPKDEKQYGENRKLTNLHKTRQRQKAGPDPDRIMPDDPNHTPLEKALAWAQETQHGPQHEARWNKVAAALGADNGYPPMTLHEAEGLWERFNRNRRWAVAVNAIEKIESDDLAAVNRYRAAVGVPPVGASDQDLDEPAAAAVGESGGPAPQYRLTPNSGYGPTPPKPGATGWYTRKAKWLPDWYWELPEMTHEDGEAAGMTSKANVAPMHYIFHKKGVGILGRQRLSDERTDLPVWTKEDAQLYYARVGIRLHSTCWLDGHLMTRKGYTDNGQYRGTPIARAADEQFEEEHKAVTVPNEIAAAIQTGDWATVATLAQERAAS